MIKVKRNFMLNELIYVAIREQLLKLGPKVTVDPFCVKYIKEDNYQTLHLDENIGGYPKKRLIELELKFLAKAVNK